MNEEYTPFSKEREIYQDNLSTVYRIAYTYLGNKRAAMAVARYTFQAMIQEGIVFPNKAAERDWLARKSVEASFATLRSGVAVGNDGLADGIVGAFLALPVELKAPAYLFYAEGCTVKKIAEILGDTQDNVLRRVDNARRYLANVMGGERNA